MILFLFVCLCVYFRYLCVDSSAPAVMKLGSDNHPKFYNSFLVAGDNPKNWKHLMKDKNITQAAIVFRVVPTASESSSIKNVTTTIRIEHKTSDGRRLYFSDIDDLKPK